MADKKNKSNKAAIAKGLMTEYDRKILGNIKPLGTRNIAGGLGAVGKGVLTEFDRRKLIKD